MKHLLLPLLLACALAVLAVAPSAAPAPGMHLGAAEDHAKVTDLVTAKAKMDLARLVGFDTIRMTAIWRPGRTAIEGDDLHRLATAAAAANLTGIKVILSVYHQGAKTTPVTPTARAEFAAWTASIARDVPTIRSFIIGNEPNLNRFWMPQFNRNGSSASPGAYLGLLALTYDALKAVSPEVEVIGGSVSPRGSDNPRSNRQTHSPVRFMRELGRLYRSSKRPRPVMDAFAFHPYGDNSSQPPEFPHPRTTTIGLADYPKLVLLLHEVFRGTPQIGLTLPIVYDEYGVDSVIPAAKKPVYKGREPATTKPVGELRQGEDYRRAIEISACQPTVKALLFFHVSDEPDLDRWQSGVFYADDTPKASMPIVQDAIERLRLGTLTPCARVQAALDRALQEQLAKPGPRVTLPKLPRIPNVPPAVTPSPPGTPPPPVTLSPPAPPGPIPPAPPLPPLPPPPPPPPPPPIEG